MGLKFLMFPEADGRTDGWPSSLPGRMVGSCQKRGFDKTEFAALFIPTRARRSRVATHLNQQTLIRALPWSSLLIRPVRFVNELKGRHI